MVGHGGPKTSLRLLPRAGVVAWLRLSLALSVSWCAHAPAAEQPLNMRLRVEWGGGIEQQWQGAISLSEGTLSDFSSLGVEADEPGSMFLLDGELQIRTPGRRVYDGVDLTVTAPAEARLKVRLAPVDQAEPPALLDIPLLELVGNYHNSSLDERNNRLLARRAPGDKLRLAVPDDRVLFSPGELLELEIRPTRLMDWAGDRLKLHTRLLTVRSARELWADQREVSLDAEGSGGPVALSLRLPEQEGVYDVVLTLSRRGLPNRLGWKQVQEERKLQVAVISPERRRPETGSQPPTELLVEIDPAQTNGWERLKSASILPALRKGPLGNGQTSLWTHALGPMIQLGPGGREPNIGWEAYPLPIQRPGQPHIIEVEYPSDAPQTLGISLVEPNAAGAVLPIGLDSGIYVPAEAADAPPRLAKHRLIVWPRTRSPLLLLTNRRDGSRAVYGVIRVYGPRAGSMSPLAREGTSSFLPPAFPPGANPGPRLLAGYYDRPLFPENFSASEELDVWSGRSLDDWQTFYEGGTRLAQYLQHVGYNGLMLAVLADGSAIYPSELLESTPRYDTGVFFATGQDLRRKDVLELLLRIFDREGLRMVPALHFASPLPALEQIRRQGGEAAVGLELIGADGQPWMAEHGARRGLAPYYNPLNERVQDAILAVVRELAGRYGRHRSLVGVALELSADGYALLPGPDWGYDDDTLARFQRDTNVTLPSGEKNFAERVKLLRQTHRSEWLAWRARTLTLFHRRVQAELAQKRPELKLYLNAAGLLDRPELANELKPALPRATPNQDVLLTVGVDPSLYQDLDNIVLLRPQRLAPLHSLAAQAVNLELNHDAELDRLFAAERQPGSLFFHEPQETRLENFETKSPFKRTYAWLVAQPAPSGLQNRRRFIHALATLDARSMFDGGWLLSMGQEAELLGLAGAYRELPDEPFKLLPDCAQPVTVRTLSRLGRTYMYLVNDSPWKANVSLQVRAGRDCTLQSLDPSRSLPGLQGAGANRTWTLELEPYDLVAATLTDAGARLSAPRVELADEVPAKLSDRIRDLWARAALLQKPPPLDLIGNSGFEQAAARGSAVAGWEPAHAPAAQPILESNDVHGGMQCVRLPSGAAFTTAPFTAPRTGWLSVAVWLRTPSAPNRAAMRLVLVGELGGQEYQRVASVGLSSEGPRIGEGWSEFAFEFPDLPTDGLSAIRLKLESAGRGDVCVDDVQLFDLEKFTDGQRLALAKTLALAESKLERREYADCLRLLESYWPRFLVTNVTLAETPIVQSPRSKEKISTAPPVLKASVMDRVKRALGGFMK